jgi:hypothetical protein
LPLASSEINESDAVVRAHDGNIIAIGGLMRQASINSDSGVPGTEGTFWRKLLGGQTNRLSEKRELVILLKPTIVDPSLEDGDLRRDALQRLLDWTDTLPAKPTAAAPAPRATAPQAAPRLEPVAAVVMPMVTPVAAQPVAAESALPAPAPAPAKTLVWAAMGSAGASPLPATLHLAGAQPVRTKRTARSARKGFVFTAAGAAAARAARPQVEAPWMPLAQRATLWSAPGSGQPQRAAAPASVRLASRV